MRATMFYYVFQHPMQLSIVFVHVFFSDVEVSYVLPSMVSILLYGKMNYVSIVISEGIYLSK